MISGTIMDWASKIKSSNIFYVIVTYWHNLWRFSIVTKWPEVHLASPSPISVTKINVTNVVTGNATCSTINDMASDVAANVALDVAAHVAPTWMLRWTMMWQRVNLGPFAYGPIKFLLMKIQSPFYIWAIKIQPVFLINALLFQPKSRYKLAYILIQQLITYIHDTTSKFFSSSRNQCNSS